VRPLPTARSETLLPTPLRRSVAVAAALSAATALNLGLYVAGTSAPSGVDTWVRPRVESLLSGVPSLTSAMVQSGDPGPVIVMTALLAALCGLLRRPFHALLALAAPATVGATTTLLKPMVGRTRQGYLAFPSGHAAGITALAVVAALLLISMAGAKLALAVSVATVMVLLAGAAIGLALVAQDWHYATDAVGGFCTAIALVAALAFLLDGLRSAARRRQPGR
jgi:membrane-associated phospholipid phosphatase